MRVFLNILLFIITAGFIYVLNKPFPGMPPIGGFIDPVNGFWANAEPVNKNFNAELKLSDAQYLKTPVTVWLDKRMVPHIHAQDNNSLYFAQGYLHAYFRLWQMDMETRAAAGRISEVVGKKALQYDRKQRRKGMVYAAENSLKAIEATPQTSEMLNAYSAGINCYIASLKYKDYPLEYKLMNFVPEKWTNLKTALLLKYMADDLTGYTEDIPLTCLRDMLSATDFELLYPEKISGSTPVIPSGTKFAPSSLHIPTPPADSVWEHFSSSDFEEKREDGKGSNNWAVSGAHTKSGAAILCNDPHLGLNLPSLWFEMQLQGPDENVYGVSLPGAPGIVIGFNDSLSWGLTNNYRDVKDFYTVKPVAGDDGKYWLGSSKRDYAKRIELIHIKGEPDFTDTVLYTVQGPVMYDKTFPDRGGLKTPLAMCWMAHRGTNELLALYMVNRAKNYTDFVNAIMNFQCPAQNFVYADRAGNIAMWGQGQFINKWKEQGRFVMNGADSAALWGDLIPMRENPHVLNPPQGYVSSANQSVTDSTYPYWYNGYFIEFRAWRINQVLGALQNATVKDMFALQNDTYSILAAGTLPIMLRYLPSSLDNAQVRYAGELKNWNYKLDAESEAAAFYQIWWDYLYNDIWSDDFKSIPDKLYPLTERTMQLMQTDTALKYYDDRNTPQVEHLGDMVRRSFKEATDSMNKNEKTIGTEWYKIKNTTVAHLTKLPAFSYAGLKTGGWGNTVDAMKQDHGPSWRMVVQMGKEIEAYGVYPGGQSGNPGSINYADFLQDWTEGKYFRLLFLPNNEKQNDTDIKYTMTLHK